MTAKIAKDKEHKMTNLLQSMKNYNKLIKERVPLNNQLLFTKIKSKKVSKYLKILTKKYNK